MEFNISGPNIYCFDQLANAFNNYTHEKFKMIRFSSSYNLFIDPYTNVDNSETLFIYNMCSPVRNYNTNSKNRIKINGSVIELSENQKLRLIPGRNTFSKYKRDEIVKEIFDDTGDLIACTVYNTAYIFFNLAGDGENYNALIAFLLEKFKSAEPIPDEVLGRLVKKELNKILSENVKRVIHEKESWISNAKQEIEEYQQILRDTYSKIPIIQAEINGLNEQSRNMSGKVEQYIKSIKNIKGVDAIAVVEGTLAIKTKPIVIRDVDKPKERYRIGQFIISFDFRRQRIKILNLNKKENYPYDHPHVNNGSPCWGNIGPEIIKMMANYQIDVLVQVLLQYLSTYNEHSAGFAPYKKLEVFLKEAFPKKHRR